MGRPEPVPPTDPDRGGAGPARFVLMRQDDNGNRYPVSRHAVRAEAEAEAAMYEARGHKQLYWVETD
jgi:hypothetical protein